MSVYLRGRGPDGPEPTGRELIVLCNGNLIPAKSITLRCDGRQAFATLEVEIDEIHLESVPATVRVALNLSDERDGVVRKAIEGTENTTPVETPSGKIADATMTVLGDK